MPRNRSGWVSRLLGWDRHPAHGSDEHSDWHEDRRRLLPRYSDEQAEAAISAPDVTKVALKLRHLIEAAIPCELDEADITKAHSGIITTKVIKAAKEAGGTEHRSCVVFGLLVCHGQRIMQSPDMDVFDEFSPPFGTILYYFFTFIVMVILLNILIALYNSAYEDIYQNANDEFLALFAQKTMQFVRAPDENVYIPPFNLVEMVVIALVGWWMPKERFEHLNDIVMAVFYSPVLLIAAYAETRTAKEIQRNRSNGEEDDDVVEEWEQMAGELDFEADGWDKICDSAKSNVEVEPAVQEVRKLKEEIDELKKLILEISKAVGAGKGSTATDLVSFDGEGAKEDGAQKAKDGAAAGSSSEVE
ncbi:vacuolar cation channel [Verticillium alfalfae VaMs.102]|uniref:Vacuolar cation channel n=1 Tax=Verticillium alfalfae (strain VaMs.102 / ATCC MYA-4576 / FGSC 10136) TaxID=526221 RepID=C9SU40_VERA1|nr:vacuolar cation channel [Verticillium alfalfae VaMs.102]EEY22351.1 vacuolar cation channel [Verticillium alfalfae VaMs.102]